MGRPQKQIDARAVGALAMAGLSNRQISEIYGIGEATIRRRFGAIVKENRLAMRINLRQKQIETAMAGNTAMLIWLGKQYLGQTDRPAETFPATVQVVHPVGFNFRKVGRK